MDTTPIVAVTGAAGAQGGAIAHAFIAAGWRVRALTRDSSRAAALAAPGITPTIVPEGDAAALEAALSGASALAVTLPVDYRRGAREAWLARLLSATGHAGVGRVALNLASRPLPGLRHPVSDSLREMEATALAGPVPATVLRPTIYMDNLLQAWAADGIRQHGVLAYPVTAETRIAWISHRTLGEAMVEAVSRPETVGQGYDIGGPAPVTGPEIAALLGRALAMPVRFETLDPAILADGLNAAFGAPAGDDIAALYRHLATVPDAMAGGTGNDALGIEAESFAEWLASQDFTAAARAA